MSQQEAMNFDVIIIGAGPSGLSAAIKLKQLNSSLTVCIVEKGAQVGSHILSGAVIEIRALQELFPNWQELNAPVNVAAKEDSFMFLTQKHAFPLPTPPQMKNHGNYIISLGQLCVWLAQQATDLGVEIYPGFAATEILYDSNQVIGVKTGDMGVAKDNSHKASYQAGINLHAKYTIFAEGCRGSLSQDLISKFNLAQDSAPQTYAIGLKELWEIDPKFHKKGKIIHTIGWPLDNATYGGSFLYHMDNNIISYGFVIGLDYQNPYLEPYEEMQRFKNHPYFRDIFKNGKRISYGARALNEGGYYSIPKLIFPGGAIIGCSAGFLNVPKIKGTHTAMKSGIELACAINHHIGNNDIELTTYPDRLKKSWVYPELYQSRNIRAGFNKGLVRGMLNAALETYIFKGKKDISQNFKPDHQHINKAKQCQKIEYPKHDGQITFDKLTSVQLSNTNHEEDQPCHLQIKDDKIPLKVNLEQYDGLEQRYCPAGVYEYVSDENGNKKLQINAQNCVHCKTCDIKDPSQNIKWVAPEGGGGPQYTKM